MLIAKECSADSSSSDIDWKSLVEAARQGDDHAFGQICDRMADYLLLAANDRGHRLTAKFGASDIVQQTLLEAHRDIASFEGSSENELRAWLVRLVQHNLVDSSRHYRQTEKRDASREQAVAIEEIADEYPGYQKTASSIIRRRETDHELLQALSTLPVKRRSIIELRHWQNLSFAEIGRELEISEAAARKLLSRALEELRKSLAINHASRPSQPR